MCVNIGIGRICKVGRIREERTNQLGISEKGGCHISSDWAISLLVDVTLFFLLDIITQEWVYYYSTAQAER